MDKLAARVVWSIKAMRSTVEQARKICTISFANMSGYVYTHCDNCSLGHIISLLVEHKSSIAIAIAILNRRLWLRISRRTRLLNFDFSHDACLTVTLELSSDAQKKRKTRTETRNLKTQYPGAIFRLLCSSGGPCQTKGIAVNFPEMDRHS